MTSMLSPEQRLRYARNISVPEIGIEGQQRLLASTVFVLGCGALGSVVATYLAGAGVGHLIIADFDTIDISNLQRQTHYDESQAGLSKADTLADRLRRLNSTVKVEAVNKLITPTLARQIFPQCDFIVDASDNPDTKYMIDAICCELSKPYSIAGVLGLNGQVMTHTPGTARYADFFPESAGSAFTPCSIGGIIGPVAGIIASIQALETIKYLTDTGSLLTDRLLLLDASTLRFTTLTI